MYAHDPKETNVIVSSGSNMWYARFKGYDGSEGEVVGVALAGKICSVNANKNIMIIATHHDGKLLLNMAKIELILSQIEPLLAATKLPNKIPITVTISVEDVNSSNVLGTFSKIISLTLEDPASVVKKCDFPRSRVITLINLKNIFEGEYQGSFRPRIVIL